MKCKQSNDVSTLAQKYSSVFKKSTVYSERVMHEFQYIKLIPWVALYNTTEDDTTCLQYQLWEFTLESGWKLNLDGKIETKFPDLLVLRLSLTGTQSCRRSMSVGFDRASTNSTLSLYDFLSKELYEYSL